MAVWTLVEPGERVAVFEEDARIDALSAARLKTLYSDLRNESWSAVLLESGQLVNEVSMICSLLSAHAIAHALTQGATRSVGRIAATCAANQVSAAYPQSAL